MRCSVALPAYLYPPHAPASSSLGEVGLNEPPLSTVCGVRRASLLSGPQRCLRNGPPGPELAPRVEPL
jgi:hypothetical protein